MKIINRCLMASLLLSACGLIHAASAQTMNSQSQNATPQQPRPTVVLPEESTPRPAAGRTEMYCAGFIQYAPSPNDLQVVGGEEEQEQRVYSQGDYVYINAGSQQGMRVGNEYTIVRPRGQFTSHWSRKKGWLGVYTQELGQLRVLVVKENVSVAQIVSACETVLLGDLLRAAEQRHAPLARTEEREFDRFADPSGKQNGRILMARDLRETLATSEVVYIDLGAEDNVRVGDYLTIYRKVGTGNITTFSDREVAIPASGGFESDRFRGGRFSNQAQRVADANSTGVYGPTVNTPEIKHNRPRMPRKIVGEMVIVNVQKRTATAVITRVAQEVHTGDYVEVQ